MWRCSLGHFWCWRTSETDGCFSAVGGREDLRRYWSDYLRRTHVLVYVVDSSDRKRLPLAKAELHRLLKVEPQLPVVVLGNKQVNDFMCWFLCFRFSVVSLLYGHQTSQAPENRLNQEQEPSSFVLSDAAALISDLRVTLRRGLNDEVASVWASVHRGCRNRFKRPSPSTGTKGTSLLSSRKIMSRTTPIEIKEPCAFFKPWLFFRFRCRAQKLQLQNEIFYCEDALGFTGSEADV